jgi:hypothetical protein
VASARESCLDCMSSDDVVDLAPSTGTFRYYHIADPPPVDSNRCHAKCTEYICIASLATQMSSGEVVDSSAGEIGSEPRKNAEATQHPTSLIGQSQVGGLHEPVAPGDLPILLWIMASARDLEHGQRLNQCSTVDDHS